MDKPFAESFLLFISNFSVRRTRSRHEGDDFEGLGGISQQAFLVGTIWPKSQNMYMFALLANL